MVLLALRHARASDPDAQERVRAARARTGCWACSEATAAGRRSTWTTTGSLLSDVPFADHNAMLDPTCPDITGRVLEALCTHAASARITRRSGAASSTCCATQERDGSWYGRWGVELHLRHVPGAARAAGGRARATARRTCCAPASGCARSRTPTAAGARAAPATTTTRSAAAPSTPSQTAWALLGLLAGGDTCQLERQRRASSTWSTPAR